MRPKLSRIGAILIFLVSFIDAKPSRPNFSVCSSITLQGQVSVRRLDKIRNCTLVLGYVRILNAKFDELSQPVFPHLTEISDHLLVFRSHNLASLDQLFPQLGLIRGHNLFQGHALVLFLSNSLHSIFLPRLASIRRGSLLISRLYHACYVHTINWPTIVHQQKTIISQTNPDCLNQKCPSSCAANHCWSERDCQFQCSPKCSQSGCFNTEPNKCCTNQLCSNCREDASCISCSKYRDLTLRGECVSECKNGSLLYESHYCVRIEDCSAEKRSLVKNGHVLNMLECVKECPVGFKSEKVISTRFCVKCADGVCKRDCSQNRLWIRSREDLNAVKNCVRVASLRLELKKNVSDADLKDAMKYLEEVDENLVIIRNRFLESLDFLKSLRGVNGKALYENKYSVFVHSNNALRQLWPGCFSVKNGKFFENPQLCMEEIERVFPNSNVSFNFNGYRRLSCSNRTIQLSFELTPGWIHVFWNVTVTDPRRLKGFTISYAEVLNNSTDSNSFEWNYVYNTFDESLADKTMSVGVEVEPFTRYAILLKAELTVDLQWTQDFRASLGPLVSDLHFVYSMPSQPSRVESLVYESLSPKEALITWKPPRKPNGLIQFYFVAYTELHGEPKTLPPEADACQFGTMKTLSGWPQSAPTNVESRTQQETSSLPKQQQQRMNDEEKNNLILVEDEIYNLALRPPLRPQMKSVEAESTMSLLPSLDLMTTTTAPKFVQNEDNFPLSNLTQLFNSTESLLGIVRREIFVQDDQYFSFFSVPNSTFNASISNLRPFGRYLLAILACQNFTRELSEYAGSLEHLDLLKLFHIETFCSKPALITLRSLPDHSLDQVTQQWLVEESGVWFLKWSRPTNPNGGAVFKYNIRFVDARSNKTQGPWCHPSLESLSAPLNQFLLAEGREYFVQVQAVSSAGAGLWSPPNLIYKVHSLSHIYWLFVAEVLSGVSALLFVCLAVFVISRKLKKSKEKGYFSINSHYYYFRPDEWEVKREDVLLEERIGSGCFAEVHRAKLRLKTNELVDCAVKFCGSDPQNRHRILKEANIMKSISTTHIVKLLGVMSKDNPACLILEFMDKGDLKEYLQNLRNNEKLSVARFYQMAAEIGDGMLWLSEHKYVHRDLAARNCLISKHDVIKIADLGLSKDIYQNPIYRDKSKLLLPIRWMSPESLIDGTATTKSDVWSFGVVLWELSTYGENPYSDKENEEVITFVKSGGHLELPPDAPIKFWTIFKKCMTSDEQKRASFKEILDILDPDLKCEFKQCSYYHNDFKKKMAKRKLQQKDSEKSIIDLVNRDPDNYL